jgi:HlyD family secretion protein
MMNRETTFHTSDTLVVTDRSSRRRWVIIGAVVVILALIGAVVAFGRSGTKTDSQQADAKAAGQIPTVTVVVPGVTQVGRVVSASGPLAAKRDQPIGIAGQGGRVIRVLVDAGSWVRAGQVLAVVDRSVQTQQAAQLAAQIEAAKANAALAQSD